MNEKSPVLEIQKEAMDASTSVSALVRKAYVVAKKLKISDAVDLFASELNGYKGDVPEYRKLFGDLKVHNPYHGYIPFIIPDEEMAHMVRDMPIGQSVESIEDLLSRDEGGSLITHFDPGREQALMSMMDLPLRPSLHIDKSQMQDILNKVRKVVLDWALELEEKSILGEGVLFSEQEKKAASTNQSIQIHNFTGIWGDVSGSTVNQTASQTVREGDLDSLRQYLRQINVSSTDADEVIEHIEDSEDPEDERITSWIGKMTSKAFKGSWDFAKEKATGALLKGIFAYFGLPAE